MDIEKQHLLKEEFPLLYRIMFTREEGVPFHCIQAFGLECGNGWFDLIYDLSAKLEALIAAMPSEQQERCYAHQIKEKFGGLRVYLSTETDEMDDLISKAEDLSYKTCETCGEDGECNTEGWLITLCEKCREEYESERAVSSIEDVFDWVDEETEEEDG